MDIRRYVSTLKEAYCEVRELRVGLCVTLKKTGALYRVVDEPREPHERFRGEHTATLRSRERTREVTRLTEWRTFIRVEERARFILVVNYASQS